MLKIIAFITSHQEIKKILKNIGEETDRAPPLLPSITTYEEDSYDWGDFPPDEFYFADEEWGHLNLRDHLISNLAFLSTPRRKVAEAVHPCEKSAKKSINPS